MNEPRLRQEKTTAPDTAHAPGTPGVNVWRDTGVAAGLALFVLALYAQLLFTNRVAAGGDILYYFYPYRALAADALRNGTIPLWNPYIFMGAPFLANPQAAALYPLHWLLSWLPVTQQVAWSAALHTWLLGLGGYALMRVWRMGRAASLVTGLVLAGSGFYGGLLGHLNQMNGAAWLPWAAFVLARARFQYGMAARRDGHEWRNALRVGAPAAGWLGGLVWLMLLAGHTQTVYINLFGLGLWVAAVAAWRVGSSDLRRTLRGAIFLELMLPAGVFGVGCAVGALAAAAQLLPTLELSNLGLRSGGLGYGEASSFSLRPLLLGWTLLPSYGLADLGVVFETSGYTEFVAYVGALGMGLAVWGALGWRRVRAVEAVGRAGYAACAFGLFFAAIGLLLALGRWNPLYFLLYQLVPGFDLFRAPARWMMLYTLGMAVLAGVGFQWLGRGLRLRQPAVARLAVGLLILGVAVDLLFAARALPHTQLTAPQAVYDVRTAPAHLLSDPTRATSGPGAMGRFLSMSKIAFDPGDMEDYRRIFTQGDPPALSDAGFVDLIVALKAQEILAPNLAMLWQIPGVDGFDGGTLPLQQYNEFLTLLIAAERLVPDGRVREQLEQIPLGHLLQLLNVQYVLTDKVQDLWFEGVYYDRQIGATLALARDDAATDQPAGLVVDAPYPFWATHVDIIGTVHTQGDAGALVDLGPNQTVAQLAVFAGDTQVDTLHLTAGSEPGAHFADHGLDSRHAETGGAVVAYRDRDKGRQEYRARLALATPLAPTHFTIEPGQIGSGFSDDLIQAVTIQAVTIQAVTIQAVTLYDATTGTFLPLLPSDRGRFRLVHSGDVKIYEYLDVLPRAYVVPRVEPVDTNAAALARLADPNFAPDEVAVVTLPAGTAHASDADLVPLLNPRGESRNPGLAAIVAYVADAVAIRVDTDRPGLLVLSDVHYPGWRAWIDGVETPVYRANHLFRAVAVPAGQSTVVFRFQPASFQWGLWLSGMGLLLLAGLFGIPRFVRPPTRPDV